MCTCKIISKYTSPTGAWYSMECTSEEGKKKFFSFDFSINTESAIQYAQDFICPSITQNDGVSSVDVSTGTNGASNGVDRIIEDNERKRNQAQTSAELEELKRLLKEGLFELKIKFDSILEKFKEVLQKTQKIPQDTISLLYNLEIIRTTNRFAELNNSYFLQADLNGLKKADDLYTNDYKLLSRDFFDSREKLFYLQTSFYSIPKIAQWYSMEVACLNMANVPNTTIISALNAYKLWFEAILNDKAKDSLINILEDLLNIQKQNVEKIKKLYSVNFTLLSISEKYEWVYELVDVDPVPDKKIVEIKVKLPLELKIDFFCKKKDYLLVPSLSKSELDKVQILIDNGLITSMDIPLAITEIISDPKQFVQNGLEDIPFQSQNLIENPEITYSFNYKQITSYCKKTIGQESEYYPVMDYSEMKKIVEELQQNGTSILFYASLLNTLKNSINHIDTLKIILNK